MMRSSAKPVPASALVTDRIRSAPSAITGAVIHGNAWGRVIGFPTANVVVPGLNAHLGIWAAIVRGEGLPVGGVLAAVSVGTRPTYYGDAGELLLEAHLVDYAGDLYGLILTVELSVHLRDELQFPDTSALVAQLAIDVQCARDWFATLGR